MGFTLEMSDYHARFRLYICLGLPSFAWVNLNGMVQLTSNVKFHENHPQKSATTMAKIYKSEKR